MLFNTDKGVAIQRAGFSLPYEWNGVQKRYYPDFIVDDHVVEIKGYLTAKDQAKLDQAPFLISLIGASEIQPYIRYAKMTYGSDFAKMLSLTP